MTSEESSKSTTTEGDRGRFDHWDVVALVGLVWLAVGLYMVFGAGWAFVVCGAIVLIGGVYGASREAPAGAETGSGAAHARRAAGGQDQGK